MNGHPSERDLLLAGEQEAPGPIADHLARCAECGERLAEVRSMSDLARRAYGEAPGSAPSPALARRMAEAEGRALAEAAGIPGRSRVAPRTLLAGALAAAAAVLLGVTHLFHGRHPLAFEEGAVVSERVPGVRSAAAPIGEARSGDRYRIRFALGERAHVGILNLDASGALNLFFPFEEAPGRLLDFDFRQPFPAGSSIEIPPSTHDAYRLDERPGTERFFLVAADRVVAEELLGFAREWRSLPAEARTPGALESRLARAFGAVRVLALEHRP
ncbi:MAG: DUF4384 domain-containing protein [Planctomycetes bacterium]|nr:DUF4384 domain-containing protein [Planctomycetota bacterium]